MPNLYATPTEIKTVMPDAVRQYITAYDNLLYQLAERISRMVDNHCRRVFYPRYETRYFDGPDDNEYMYIDDLVAVGTAYYSEDDGVNYTAFTSSDLWYSGGDDYNWLGSYNKIKLNINNNATADYITSGQRAVKIVGVWGYTDDRAGAWEDIQDDVENNPLAIDGTSLTVNDADGADTWGLTPRFQAGQLVRFGGDDTDEMAEITFVNTTANTCTIVRGRNGSTAEAQTQNTNIYLWKTPPTVKQSCIIQAIRQLERGLQGFADARATPEIGQMFYIKQLDPEVTAMLQPYVRY